VLVDEYGATIALGRRRPVLSPKVVRAVPLRDGHCRWPGCDRRAGLQVHHLVPRSWGGTDDISNLATVCWGHHPLLVPHGNLALVGNPNQPDGLRLVSYDQLDDDDARHWGLPPPRRRRE
jgi:HNH endonuclease